MVVLHASLVLLRDGYQYHDQVLPGDQIVHVDDIINMSTWGSETDAATESGAAVAD